MTYTESIHDKIKKLGHLLGWQCIDHQKKIFMLSFMKEDSKVNVYYSRMTVATCITHPTKGRTQLFRKKVSMKQLERIFNNPRMHTDKGYYKKRKVNKDD